MGKKVGNGLKGWKIEKCVGVEGIEKGLGYCRKKLKEEKKVWEMRGDRVEGVLKES